MLLVFQKMMWKNQKNIWLQQQRKHHRVMGVEVAEQ
jgi:hypothetical protein